MQIYDSSMAIYLTPEEEQFVEKEERVYGKHEAKERMKKRKKVVSARSYGRITLTVLVCQRVAKSYDKTEQKYLAKTEDEDDVLEMVLITKVRYFHHSGGEESHC